MDVSFQLDALLAIGISAILGGLIGLERELLEKPAGLRTHILVSASASLLVVLGDVIINQFSYPEFVRSDPIRIIEAIIVGISFLGAGTIIQREREERVEGLTTSASVLMAAAIGAAVGLGQLVLASAVAVLVVFVNRALSLVERWLGTLDRRW